MSKDQEERLQQYLDGRMDPRDQLAFEEELLGDPDLMAAAYDDISVRDSLKESAQARRIVSFGARSPRRRKWALPFLTVATAASIAFLVFVLPRPTDHEVFRGEAATAPRAVEPLGDVATAPVRFVWTRDPGATQYRLEIFGPDGSRLHVSTTSDTVLVFDQDFTPPASGHWKATSLDSIGVGVHGTGKVDYQAP